MTQTISRSAATTSPKGVTVEPAAGRIGAEISGVDISQPLDPETLAVIQNALDTWKVVFFRDQQLDHESQIAFGRQFGDLTYAHPHDDEPPEGYPEIYTVDPRRFEQRYGLEKTEREAVRKYSYTSGWHTDVTPAHNPPAGSILRADVVPGYGGDTTFTNLVAAYEGLSEPVRRLRRHLVGGAPLRSELLRANAARRRASASASRRTRWSRTTPSCGCTRGRASAPCSSIRASSTTSSTSTPLESRWILDHLFAEITRPEYTVRFRWAPGSVAFWDNRATAHLGPQDLGHLDVERVLHRVTLIGEVPVGPDGRESELVEGAPVRGHAGVRFRGALSGITVAVTDIPEEQLGRRRSRRATATARPVTPGAVGADRARAADPRAHATRARPDPPDWPGGSSALSRCSGCGSWSARSGCSPRSRWPHRVQVFDAARQLWAQGVLQSNLLISLQRVAEGLAFGDRRRRRRSPWLWGLFWVGEDLFDPVIQAARAVPILGLVPLAIIWFGVGETPKMFLIALGMHVPRVHQHLRGDPRRRREAGGGRRRRSGSPAGAWCDA